MHMWHVFFTKRFAVATRIILTRIFRHASNVWRALGVYISILSIRPAIRRLLRIFTNDKKFV